MCTRTVLLACLIAVFGAVNGATEDTKKMPRKGAISDDVDHRIALATFAGGCFWCMEPPFDALDGVISTTSGFTGGPEVNPTYKEVSSGSTGHAEAIEIRYDPSIITYAELLHVFWHNIDPTTTDRQFCDWGSQYRTAIFYHDDEQRALAVESKAAIERAKILDHPIVTEITASSAFYPAEEYHQDFYKKNPTHYKQYRRGCGRDKRLEELWGDAARAAKGR